MARPDENPPDDWVEKNRRALEQLSISQMGRYAPRDDVPAPRGPNFELPTWLTNFLSEASLTLGAGETIAMGNGVGSSDYEADKRRHAELVQGGASAETAIRQRGLEKEERASDLAKQHGGFHGGPKIGDWEVPTFGLPTLGNALNPFLNEEAREAAKEQVRGAAVSAVTDPLNLIPGVGVTKEPVKQALKQGAKIAGKGALKKAALEGVEREAQYGRHLPTVRKAPDQGTGAGLRERLGMTKDQFADVGPKQQAAVDAMGKNFDEYIAKRADASGRVPKLTDAQKAEAKAPIEPAGRYVDTTPGQGQRGGTAPELKSVASSYIKAIGVPEPTKTYTGIDRALARKIADVYEATPDMSMDPAVQKAYAAFNAETAAQAETLKAAGYVAEPWTKPGQPYKNSAEMRADVQNNKHIWYFTTQEGSPIHSLMTPEQNDTFRWVHDVFGHALHGNEFGAVGEENAWLAHSQMFSDEARKAMSTETRAQNSWVNFGPYGEVNRANPANTTYPAQKAMILPDELRQPAGSAYGDSATMREIEEASMSEAEIAQDRARRVSARGLAADEPGVGKRTWTDEEKALLATLDTGKFSAKNIIKQVMGRSEDQIAISRVWYEELRRELEITAAELGIESDALAGVWAALSPRTSWPRGETRMTASGNAARTFDSSFPAKNNVRGAELLVKEWQTNEVLQNGTLSEIRDEMKRIGASQWTTFPNGAGKAGTGNAEKAIRILNGEDPKKVLRQKTGSFLDNFLGNEDNVTGDVWAIRAALDNPLAPDRLTPKQYEQLQNAYRQAAAELGYTPEATQAIAWDAVRENPKFAVGTVTKAETRRLLSVTTARARAVEIDEFDPLPGSTSRGLRGKGNQDAARRIVQLGDTSITDAAKQYEAAKDVPGFKRTAAEKIAFDRAEAAGQGGGKPDLGFQNEYFSPQTQRALPAIKDVLRPELAARTAPLTQEDILHAAQLNGQTPEWNAKNLPKRGTLSVDIVKVGLGVEEKLTLVDNVAAKLRKGGGGAVTPAERLDALFAMREAAGLLKDFGEGVSETARALAMRKIQMKRALVLNPSEAEWRAALRQVIGAKGRNPDQVDKLLLDLAAARGDKPATMRILRGLNRGNGWDMAFEFSQANILTAIPTHAVNIYSGAVQHTLMWGRIIGETAIQVAISPFVKNNAGAEDVAAAAVGYLDGLKGVSGRTYDLLRRRMDFYEYSQGQFAAKHGGESIPIGGAIAGDVELFGKRIGLDALGEAVRTPFKALTIEDMFQTMPAFNARMRQLAAQQARKEGLKGKSVLDRAAEIARDPSDALVQEAHEFAERYALHNRGAGLNSFQQFLANVPGLRYIVRFTTTPTNLVHMGLDYSPLGITRLVENPLTPWRVKKNVPVRDKSAILAEAAIGTAIISTFMGMLESGEMTGLRPVNKTERDLMEAEGVGPMMVQSSKVPLVGGMQHLFNQNGDVDKRWVTGAVLGPLIVPYLIAGAIREVESQSRNPDIKAMQAAVGAMVRTFADQVPMLQGVGDINNILESPKPFDEAADLLAQTARTFVPGASLLSMFERMVDQYRRKPEGLVQTIQSIIPFLAEHGIDVGPLHVTPVNGIPDVLGRPVENANTGLLAITPRGSNERDSHPALVENKRLGQFGFPGYTGLTKTGPTLGSGTNAITLSPDAAARYQEIAGQLTERFLNELMNSPAYANKSDEQKAKDFQTKIDFARLEARKRLAEEFMGTITDDFGLKNIVARVQTDKAIGISIGMRATSKLHERADFISGLLTTIDSDPALRDAVQAEMTNRPRGPLMSGTIEEIVDGDNIKIGGKSIRLFGVDVPENNTPEGREAAAKLTKFLTGKTITYQLSDQTSFERTIGEVYANGQSVTDWLVKEGIGTVHLPPENDPNRYSLDVYRQVIPLREQLKSSPVLSAEYVRNGQPFGDEKTWEEAKRQKVLWDLARKGGDTTFQADRKYPVYATYRTLANQAGGKNPVRKKFVEDAEKKGIPLSKFIGDLD